MPEHDRNTTCIAEFKTLGEGLVAVRGDIDRLKNGHATQAEALTKLTDAVELAARDRRSEHDETVRMFQGYQSQVLSLTGELGERTALTAASVKSAHKRLDGLSKVIVGIAITVCGALIVAGILGLAKYLAGIQAAAQAVGGG